MKKFFASFFLISIWFCLWAHPHIWVESSLALEIKNGSEAELQVDWSFDQMFTGIICEDYGLEKGGKVSHSQAKRIEEEAFSNLVNFDFYTYIFVDGVAQTIKYKKFKVKLLGDKIVYSFQVPLKLPDKSNFTIQFACYDPTIFTDLLLADDPLVMVPEGYSYTMSYGEYEVLAEIEFPQMVNLEVEKK